MQSVLLGRIVFKECQNTGYCYRCSVVCVYVCLSVGHNHELHKKDKPIEMPFGTWTRVSCKEPSIGRRPGSPRSMFGAPLRAAFLRTSLTTCCWFEYSLDERRVDDRSSSGRVWQNLMALSSRAQPNTMHITTADTDSHLQHATSSPPHLVYKSVHTVQPVLQPAGRNVLNMQSINK